MDETTLLVRSGQLVAAHDQPAILNGALAIAGETIRAVGTYEELSAQYPGTKEIGGDHFLVIPGLINGHSHGRGLTDFQRGARDNTLETWRFDTYNKFVPISIYDDVSYSAARLLKSGVTTTMHNQSLAPDPTDFEKKFEDCLRAYSDAGMRVLLCPAISNDNRFVYGDNEAIVAALSEESRKILTASPAPGALTAANYVQAVRDLHKKFNGGMSRIGFGPVAPQWCTKDLLVGIRREADRLGVPIHTHALQTIFQKNYALRFLGKSLITYMNDIGLLGRNVVIGHCVFPTESDIELLARTDTGVTHHPSCNLRVRNGIAPAFHMLRAGVRVGLGLDGKSINDDDDFIQEMKVCFLLHRIPSLDVDSPHLSARNVFKMATEIGSTLVGYGDELGRLEPGRKADLVLLDYKDMCRPFVDPSHDPIETILYRGIGRHVHTVLVNGRIVVQGGQLLTLDEEAIGNRLAEAASRPRTEPEVARINAMDELRVQMVHYYQGWTEDIEWAPYFHVNSRIDGK
jgi:cytosine/adenosine deaminase-related metal-dependent hydrolase